MTDASHPSGSVARVSGDDPAAGRPLDAPTIRRLLVDRTMSGGDEWRVGVVDTTGSTNSDLLAAVRADGYDGPTMLAAERQTAGRGRLGRAWSSTGRLSLTVSYALRVARPMAALDGVTLVCGLAACDAIALHDVDARLKWPNDLLVDGRKLAGILVEALPFGAETVLIVGVGINIGPGSGAGEHASGALSATDLRTAGGTALGRNRLAAELGLALQRRLAAFAEEGFAAFADPWNRRDAFRDRPVVLLDDAVERLSGVARGVDGGGALLIDTADGRRRIVSGDVSLRLADQRASTA